MRTGGALLSTKILLGLAAGYILGHLIGIEPVHSGFFAGISTLAVVAAINDTNGGLYMSLMEQYGTPEDSAAYTVMALESGPFLTMVSLGVAGLSGFPWQTLVGAVLPLAVGMLLGNLDPEMRKLLSSGVSVLIPFFAFALGATLDLHRVLAAGLLGLALGLAVVFCLRRLPHLCVRPPHRRQWKRRHRGLHHSGERRRRSAAGRCRQPPLRQRRGPCHRPGRRQRHRQQYAGPAAHRSLESPCQTKQSLRLAAAAPHSAQEFPSRPFVCILLT